jgi:hypothetical protein
VEEQVGTGFSLSNGAKRRPIKKTNKIAAINREMAVFSKRTYSHFRTLVANE